jgi:predicted nucleic acid-binding protein
MEVLIALDTNLLVRFFMRDGDDAAEQATRLISERAVFVPITVMMETYWVLRSNYKKSRGQIAAAFDAFIGLPTVTLQLGSEIAAARRWTSEGLDFADALHLSLSSTADAFATFDEDFLKMSKRIAASVPVRRPHELEGA